MSTSYLELEQYLTDAEKTELARLIASDTRFFFPVPGPQLRAALSEADIIGYGGAAGGGKTRLMAGLALTEHIRSVIFRQYKNQTQYFVQDFEAMLGDAKGYSSQNSQWKHEHRLIEFAGLEDPSDHLKWRGRAHDFYGLDEATEMREKDVRFVIGWCRTDDPNQRCRVLLTFNPPSSAEGRWVMRFFAPWLDRAYPNRAADGELRWFTTIGNNADFEVPNSRPFVIDKATGEFIYDFDPVDYRGEKQALVIRPKSRTFIHAKVTDNPYYMATGYIDQLQAMPEPYRSQMLHGDFMAGVEDDTKQVIPTVWIEMAFERYRQRAAKADFKLGPLDALGVDAARGGNMGGTTGMTGKDKMVITPRHGDVLEKQIVLPGIDVNTGGKAAAEIVAVRRDDAPVHLDVIGIGTSVLDVLVENHVHVVSLNGTAKSFARTKQGNLGYFNKRAELVWKMREALDPAGESPLAIYPDQELLADLAAFTATLTSTGLKIRPKDEIKALIGRSPDKGESAIYAAVVTPKRMVVIGGYAGLDLAAKGSYEEQRLKELQ